MFFSEQCYQKKQEGERLKVREVFFNKIAKRMQYLIHSKDNQLDSIVTQAEALVIAWEIYSECVMFHISFWVCGHVPFRLFYMVVFEMPSLTF